MQAQRHHTNIAETGEDDLFRIPSGLLPAVRYMLTRRQLSYREIRREGDISLVAVDNDDARALVEALFARIRSYGMDAPRRAANS